MGTSKNKIMYERFLGGETLKSIGQDAGITGSSVSGRIRRYLGGIKYNDDIFVSLVCPACNQKWLRSYMGKGEMYRCMTKRCGFFTFRAIRQQVKGSAIIKLIEENDGIGVTIEGDVNLYNKWLLSQVVK